MVLSLKSPNFIHIYRSIFITVILKSCFVIGAGHEKVKSFTPHLTKWFKYSTGISDIKCRGRQRPIDFHLDSITVSYSYRTCTESTGTVSGYGTVPVGR